ncbi:hypothetical protein IWQ55_000289 [Labrenzia sp. EL_208]|nr:hypothetical protein [Labrenzia sp. EL_132]MBG6227097.1 hypothetical protein [Labrenzia sp. EL_208]
MSYPTDPSRDFSFTAFAQALGDNSFPGQQMDVELDDLIASVISVNDFLKTSFRTDGKLKNGSVTRDQLATDIQLGFNTPSVWETGTSYTAKDSVFDNNKMYLATAEHVAGPSFAADLAADLWSLLVDFEIPAATAQVYVDQAEAARDIAQASAISAANSATATAGSEATVSANATAAANSATAAGSSAGNAAASATTASNAATSAGTDAGVASAAKTAAESARDSAQAADASAQTAKTDAETAATNATTFVTNAQAEIGLGRMPIGTVLWTAGNVAPVSTLVLNGQTVSRATYAALWAWVQTSGNLAASEGAKGLGQFGPGDGSTTFSLPDLDDMFIRAKGDARQIGSYQADAFQHFEGTLGNYSSIGFTGSQLDGVFTTDGAAKANRTSGETGTTYKAKIDPSIQARTADETRPQNVAYIPVIVAYHQIIDPAQLQAAQALTDISNNASGLATAQTDLTTLQGQQLGVGQTWVNPGRTAGVWYQNTDTKPIMVGLRGGSNGSATLDYSQDGVTADLTFHHNSVNGAQLWNTIIIPPGDYFRFGGFHSSFYELA